MNQAHFELFVIRREIPPFEGTTAKATTAETFLTGRPTKSPVSGLILTGLFQFTMLATKNLLGLCVKLERTRSLQGALTTSQACWVGDLATNQKGVEGGQKFSSRRGSLASSF